MSSVSRSQGAPTAKRAAIQAAVLHATEELLAEGASYADLNVERIATRAGISRTAFYFYFADKRELLMRLTEEVSQQLYSEAQIWWAGEGDDPAQEVRRALGNIARLYEEHGVLLGAIVEVSTYDDEVARFWRALVGGFADATRARIESEQAAGRAPAMDAAATAFALTWMTERVFYQGLVQPESASVDQLIDSLAGIWVRTVYGRV